MNRTAIYILSLCWILFTACLPKSNATAGVEHTSATVDSIPEGAIPFEYDSTTFEYIIFNAVLNDSIPVKALWDTGSSGVGVSDSLYQILANKTGHVQIGEYTTSPKNIRDLGPFWSDVMDRNTILIGWQMFDEKIIEISFQKRYMREILDTAFLSKLIPIPMNFNDVKHLRIPPVTIYIDGHSIERVVIIDTGYNGDISIGNMRAINFPLDTLYQGKSHAYNGAEFPWATVRADSIKAGSLVFKLSQVFISSAIQGRIGTRFLKNFTVIFDFKNYRLYLLPLEKEKIGITK